MDGEKIIDEALGTLQFADANDELTWSTSLYSMAKRFASELNRNGTTTLSLGVNEVPSNVTVCFSFGESNPLDIIINMIVDDGNVSRTNR